MNTGSFPSRSIMFENVQSPWMSLNSSQVRLPILSFSSSRWKNTLRQLLPLMTMRSSSAWGMRSFTTLMRSKVLS